MIDNDEDDDNEDEDGDVDEEEKQDPEEDNEDKSLLMTEKNSLFDQYKLATVLMEWEFHRRRY